MEVSKSLKEYIEDQIIPRYDGFDLAHQRNHVQTVIEQSLLLAQYYDVHINMVYAIAAYHDTGLCVDRKTHHQVSGQIIRSDRKLSQWFEDEEIEVMAQAVEDHRASSDHAPRSIYGMIVAEADRFIDTWTIVERTVMYGCSHYPEKDEAEQYERTRAHLKEKYGDGGYLKLWIPQSPNVQRLEALRAVIRDEDALHRLYDDVCKSLRKKKNND